MAAFDFPSSPSVNQTYTANGVTWKWNGTMWMRVSGAGYLEKIEEGNSKIEVDDSGSGNITATTDGTERLRITPTGVINCGHGSAINLHGSATTGVNINGNGNSGQIIANASNNRALIIGRQLNYGQVIEFFQGTNTNDAAITIPAANSFGIQTGSTERLRIDSNGVITGRGELRLTEGTSAVNNGDEIGSLMFTYPSNNNKNAKIVALQNAGTSGADLAFFTRTHGDGTNADGGEERLRIDSSGNIGIGTETIQANTNYNTLEIVGDAGTTGGSIVRLKTGNLAAKTMLFCDTGGFEARVETSHPIVFSTDNTERLRIREAGGHRIQCNESWHAANLSECNTDKLALNINQTRQGQTKGIALGCVGSGSGATGIQAYDTSDNSANTLELNPFGGNLLYGDTASDLSNDHKFIAVGAKHAFQYDGNAGTYLSVILGAANGTVDLEADARSGAYPDLRFITTNDEQLRVLAAGHIWKKGDGALWHGTTDINDFSNANRSNYNKVSIRAGDPNDGTSPTNDNSAIKIYPAGNRGTTAGTLSGGIAWQHLDPTNGDWDTYYGAGAQIWMGSAIHDTPGQERGRFNLWMNSQITGNTNPNNLAIEAYPNGMVRHPKNPAFMVRNSNNANAFSANARATWDTTLLNNGSHFDMTNNIFTAPIDGIYTFNCMMLSNANTRLFHNFRVNNTIIEGTRSEGHAVSGSYATCTITMTYSLSASDYVDVYVRNNNAYGGVYTNFNGYLVG